MAFPTLQSSTTTVKSTAGTSHVLSNPSGSTVGSLVIHRFTTNDAPTFTWSTGWTSIITDTASGSGTKTGVRYRVLDGGGNDTCTVTTGASVESACISTRHTGYDTTTPCSSGAVTADQTADPDPPQSTPGGSVDYSYQSGFGADNKDTVTPYISNSHTAIAQVTSSSTASTACQACAQYRNLNAINLNPAGMHQNAERLCVSYTFAIIPGDGAESGGSVTGTIAVTSGTSTAAFTATKTHSGTIAVTSENSTASLTGTETFSGTIAVTSGNSSASITGVETYSGTISVTSGNSTAAFTGTETFSGTIGVTSGNSTFSGDAISISGQIAVTSDNSTAAFTGTETFSGTIAVTSGNSSASFTAIETYSGTISVTSDNSTASLVGVETYSGTIAVTSENSTASLTGTETFSGTIGVTGGDSTFQGEGAVTEDGFSGSIAVTSANSTASFTAVETFSGTISVTSGNSTSSITATETISGTIAVTSGDSAFAGSAIETFTGTIGVTSANSTFEGEGTVSAVDHIIVTISPGSLILTGAPPRVVLTTTSTGGGKTVYVNLPDLHPLPEPSRRLFIEVFPQHFRIKHKSPTIIIAGKRRAITVAPGALKIRGYAPQINIAYNDERVISELFTLLELLELTDGA